MSGVPSIDAMIEMARTGQATDASLAAPEGVSGAKLTSEAAMTETKQPSQDTTTEAKPSENGAGADADAKPKSVFSEAAPGPKKRTVAEMLGEVTWLMTQSPRHKTFFLSDLEWMAMTPILLNQFRVFYGPDRPIGVAFWAFVDAEVEARLAQGSAKLRPQDWKSGDRLWVVDIVSPFGGHEEMLQDLKANVFADRTIKYLAFGDGKTEVKEA